MTPGELLYSETGRCCRYKCPRQTTSSCSAASRATAHFPTLAVSSGLLSLQPEATPQSSILCYRALDFVYVQTALIFFSVATLAESRLVINVELPPKFFVEQHHFSVFDVSETVGIAVP